MELVNTNIPILSMSKKDVRSEAKSYVANIIEKDSIAPMAVFLQAKKAEELFKTILEELKPIALKEAEKYSEAVVKKYGAKFEKTSVYTEYDFTVCKDSVLVDLLMEEAIIKKKLEERKAFLKSLKNPLIVTDEETGETYKIYPPLKKTTDGLKVTY